MVLQRSSIWQLTVKIALSRVIYFLQQTFTLTCVRKCNQERRGNSWMAFWMGRKKKKHIFTVCCFWERILFSSTVGERQCNTIVLCGMNDNNEREGSPCYCVSFSCCSPCVHSFFSQTSNCRHFRSSSKQLINCCDCSWMERKREVTNSKWFHLLITLSSRMNRECYKMFQDWFLRKVRKFFRKTLHWCLSVLGKIRKRKSLMNRWKISLENWTEVTKKMVPNSPLRSSCHHERQEMLFKH